MFDRVLTWRYELTRRTFRRCHMPREAPVVIPVPVPDPAERATSQEQPTKAKKSRPTKYLPTDRIAPQKQLDLLRAWGAASGPSGKAGTNGDVASIVGLSSSTVSLANPFFVENGLLQKTDNAF